MTASEAIEKRLAEIKMSKTDLANSLGTTKQNLGNKFRRDNFSAHELVDIGKAVGLRLVMIADNGLQYIIEYDGANPVPKRQHPLEAALTQDNSPPIKFEVDNSKTANHSKANDAK